MSIKIGTGATDDGGGVVIAWEAIRLMHREGRIDRATNTGEVLGSVSVEGVELGGLGREDAAARLADLEATLASTPICAAATQIGGCATANR